MKKTLKIILIFLFAFTIFSIGKCVEANSIKSIYMDIYVDKKGDAHIKETWVCNVTQGTEVYHPYYNLGNSEIKDFTVSEGINEYTSLSHWNTSGTLESKSYKCGINRISNGVELCWGISRYGSHTYTAKYTITNFVSETTDAQMIYWTLIPYEFSNSIGKAYIKIHTDFKIQDTIDVWGYGNYGGTAYVYDGYIEMQSDGNLATDEYITILVKFPLGTFNTTNRLNNNFEYYYNMAEDGADKYKKIHSILDTMTNSANGIFNSLIKVFVFLYNAFIIYIICWFIKRKLQTKKTITKIDYGISGKYIPKDVPYFRDIPCKKDIFRAFYVGYKYDLIENKSDIIGAMILKWIKERKIELQEKETGLIFKKENIVIVLKEMDSQIFLEPKEEELFRMMLEASEDGYLESKEFEKWCERSYTKILSWFVTTIRMEELKLINEGIVQVNKISDGKRREIKTYIMTEELKKEALELAGLKRYLEEYSLIKERDALEVQLFEDYLIFAQMLGIAKKVSKQFEDIYPELIQQSSYISYDYINYIHISTNRGIVSATTAKARASNYSLGGGGFSSGGGGGGSFGGGGGGRRLQIEKGQKGPGPFCSFANFNQNTCKIC